MKLENKVAIITGGAMGIGKGILEKFLEYGAKVSIFDMSDKLEDTVKEFAQKGYTVIGNAVDIRNVSEVKKAVLNTKERFGKIDILVNNAGVAKIVDFREMTDEIRDFHFDINIKGAWNVTKAVVEDIIANKGAIVNMASVTGNMVADPGEVAYATTKAAMKGFTKGLAAELAEYGVRVNAISPGYILTPMVNGIAKDSSPNNPQAVVDGIAEAIPLKRLGTPAEVGELAAFLASAEASYLTGQEFVIDGGSTLPETSTVGQ